MADPGLWSKDVEENVIYVSRGYDTEIAIRHEFRMHDFHFITDNPWKGQRKGDRDYFQDTPYSRIYRRKRLIQEEGETGSVFFYEKLQGIAPGQFGVIYDEEARVCVGSGRNKRSLTEVTE